MMPLAGKSGHRFAFFATALILLTCSAKAETVILECVADGSSSGAGLAMKSQNIQIPGTMVVSFRTWNVTRWSVQSAAMFVHLAQGEAPAKVEVAGISQPWGEIEPPKLDAAQLRFITLDVHREPEGWLEIKVPGSLVEDMAANRAHGLVVRFKAAKDAVLHARESRSFAPYLIVTGTRK